MSEHSVIEHQLLERATEDPTSRAPEPAEGQGAGAMATQARQQAVFGAAAGGIEPFDLQFDFNEDEFNAFVRWAVQHRASDLTMQSGDYITAQIQGVWRPVTRRCLEANEIERIVTMKYGPTGISMLDSGEPLDFRLQAVMDRDTVLGFRANATRCRIGEIARGISITARSIPGLPPRLCELDIEPEIVEALFPRYGLILVIGTTGCGKSTLMAASIRHRLEEQADKPVKIITFEEPIEYTYGRLGLGKMPLVSQVEIGASGGDLKTWSMAGPNAMRRKGDVIIMGELRDLNSVMAAFEMAESGHAVMATLHVETPAQAVDRLVSFFPIDGQPAAANKLRAALRLIVGQKLVGNRRGTRTAFRSWLTFDRELKAALACEPFHKWEPMLARLTAARQANFESTAYPALRDGLIDFDTFMEVASLTRAEALDFCHARGLDVGAMG